MHTSYKSRTKSIISASCNEYSDIVDATEYKSGLVRGDAQNHDAHNIALEKRFIVVLQLQPNRIR